MGVETFSEQTMAVMAFQHCRDIPVNERNETCYNKTQLKDWSDKYDPKMGYISTFAWMDLAEPVDYFKQTITQETIGSVNYLD